MYKFYLLIIELLLQGLIALAHQTFKVSTKPWKPRTDMKNEIKKCCVMNNGEELPC
jgi:hypothetical protein